MASGMWDNNYFKKHQNNKTAKLFLPSINSPNTKLVKETETRIKGIAHDIYGYIDQFCTVSKTSLGTLFGKEISTDYRLKELISIAIWIHTDSAVMFSLGDSKENADTIFFDYIAPWSDVDDARVIRYFLNVFTMFGFFALDDDDQSFLRSSVYNCVTTAFLFEKNLLSDYIDLISSPARVTDVANFYDVVLSSYACRTNLLYIANSNFFKEVEPNLKDILASLTKEVELV